MNPKLLAFLVAQLAAHRRVNRYTDNLVAIIVGDRQYAVEGCACGFEIQRPMLANAATLPRSAAAQLIEKQRIALMVESQWTDHLIEIVSLGVATWLDQQDQGDWGGQPARMIRGM